MLTRDGAFWLAEFFKESINGMQVGLMRFTEETEEWVTVDIEISHKEVVEQPAGGAVNVVFRGVSNMANYIGWRAMFLSLLKDGVEVVRIWAWFEFVQTIEEELVVFVGTISFVY